jgi:hypothetical protein
MHGDHAFGLVPFLCALADGVGGVLEGADWREREAARSVSYLPCRYTCSSY